MGQPPLVNLIKGAGAFQSNESIWLMLQKAWENSNIQLNILGGEKAHFQMHQVLILSVRR